LIASNAVRADIPQGLTGLVDVRQSGVAADGFVDRLRAVHERLGALREAARAAPASAGAVERALRGVEEAVAALQTADSALVLPDLRVADWLPAIVAVARGSDPVSYYNARWYEYTGLTPDDVGHGAWERVIHPDDYGELFARWQRAGERGEPGEGEARLRRADGVYRWHLARTVPVRGADGTVEAWVLTAIDIDDMRRAEEERRRTEQRYRSLAEALPALVSLSDGTRIAYFNRRWSDYTGVDLSDPAAWDRERFIHPDDLERLEAVTREGTERAEPFEVEFRIRRHDGAYRWHLGRTVPVDGGSGATTFIGATVDIDDRRRAEDALRVSEETYRSLTESLPAMVVTADPQGTTTYFNRHWYEYTGLSEEESVSPWTRVLHREDLPRLGELWSRAFETQTGFETEYRMLGRDGTYHWMLGSVAPVRDDAGELRGWVGTGIDIDARRRAEEAQRLLASAGQVLAAAHDYETTLKELARVSVPVFADATTVVVFNDDGSTRRLMVTTHDAELDMVARAAMEIPPGVDEKSSILKVMRSGEPMLLREIGDETIVSATDDEHLREVARADAPRSAVIVPLKGRGDPFGAVTFSYVDDRRYTEQDLDTAREFARNAAYAIENARLVEERAREERTQRFLAEASSVLASGLDTETILNDVVQLAVSALADLCTLDVIEADGSIRRAALSARDPADEEVSREIAARYPPDPRSVGARQALAEGTCVFIPGMSEEFLAAAAQDEEHLRLLRKFGPRSFIVVPMRARGRTLGALSLAAPRGVRWDLRDLALAEEFGRRAALAVDNALLYEAERQARTDAVEAGARYRTMAEAIPQLVWTARPDGYVDYYNQRWFEYTGLGLAETEGSRWHDVMHPDDVAFVTDRWAYAVATGEPYEARVRMRRHDGQYRWHIARALPVRAGAQIVAWFGTTTDVDDEVRDEESQRFLADAGTLLGSSLDIERTLRDVARMAVPRFADWCAVDLLADDGSITRATVANADQTRIDWLREISRPYPIEPNANYGGPLIIRTGRSLLVEHVTEEILRRAVDNEGQLRLMLDSRLCSFVGAPLIARGRVLGAITFFCAESGRHFDRRDLDVAEALGRRAGMAVDSARLYEQSQLTAEELRRANQAKDEFLGLVSHELRTPITTIFGNAQVLRNRGEYLDDEARAASVADIEQESERLNRIIDNMLVLARVEAGREILAEPVQAHRVVRRFVDTHVQRHPYRRLEADVPSELPPVSAEPTYFEQVLRNLLSNAEKYSPPDRPIEVRVSFEAGQVAVRVLDRGAGIQGDETDLIFAPFYRSRRTSDEASGTGIGLAVCKRLVDAQGGRIWARRREHGGSEFGFSLPIDREARA
jgi:PAS domain S-box-containing protein